MNRTTYGRRVAPDSQLGLEGDDGEVDFIELPAPVGALLNALHHEQRH